MGPLIVLSALGSGCNIYFNAARNLLEAPVDRADNGVTFCRFRKEADVAWEAFSGANPDHHYSSHFERGFKFGFVDYLEDNGPGKPPYLPIWCFRHDNYESPEGFQKIADWDAGFQEGTAAAVNSGLREYYILPTPARLLGVPVPTTTDPHAVPSPAGTDTLPSPRPYMPPATTSTGGGSSEAVVSGPSRSGR
jgi:hypothetical protein